MYATRCRRDRCRRAHRPPRCPTQSWLPELLSELATLGFFVTTGCAPRCCCFGHCRRRRRCLTHAPLSTPRGACRWKFRPTSNNPYLQLAAADDSPPEDEDYGLDSGSDHELPGGARARRGAAGEGGAEDKALELPEKP